MNEDILHVMAVPCINVENCDLFIVNNILWMIWHNFL